MPTIDEVNEFFDKGLRKVKIDIDMVPDSEFPHADIWDMCPDLNGEIVSISGEEIEVSGPGDDGRPLLLYANEIVLVYSKTNNKQLNLFPEEVM